VSSVRSWAYDALHASAPAARSVFMTATTVHDAGQTGRGVQHLAASVEVGQSFSCVGPGTEPSP